MKNRLLCFLFIASIFSCKTFHELRPFKTDNCSCFPDGTIEDPQKWKSCCIVHDSAYWKGGTKYERLIADSNLYKCVCEKSDSIIALAMFKAVRIWGSPYLPFSWRWGYGWRYFRPYKK